MNTPSHEAVTQRARQLWRHYGRPDGRDTEIWLEAERQLAAGQPDSSVNPPSQEAARTVSVSESKGASGLTERVHAGNDPAPTHATPAPHDPDVMPGGDGAKAAQQKKAARAPKVPSKGAPKPLPAETGKPLWDKPHSS
jgi:hypothetical protein